MLWSTLWQPSKWPNISQVGACDKSALQIYKTHVSRKGVHKIRVVSKFKMFLLYDGFHHHYHPDRPHPPIPLLLVSSSCPPLPAD